MKHLKKIGKSLKVVLLSIFYMDYQIAEETKLKVSKFKLAFVVLTITTILWIMVFYALRQYFFIMGITLSAGWLGFITVAIARMQKNKTHPTWKDYSKSPH